MSNRAREALLAGVFCLGLAAPALSARAAELGGVAMPETETLAGTPLRLNGIALRTYSWLRVHIYVAGLYLEHAAHDANTILHSPEKKLLVIRFVHDVDAENARSAWREGLERNCLPPCHLAPGAVDRFLAEVTPMRAGDVSTLAWGPDGVEFATNGRSLGKITDPTFANAILATFIGPAPPSEGLKEGLLGLGH
jgi:hypothetical protein